MEQGAGRLLGSCSAALGFGYPLLTSSRVPGYVNPDTDVRATGVPTGPHTTAGSTRPPRLRTRDPYPPSFPPHKATQSGTHGADSRHSNLSVRANRERGTSAATPQSFWRNLPASSPRISVQLRHRRPAASARRDLNHPSANRRYSVCTYRMRILKLVGNQPERVDRAPLALTATPAVLNSRMRAPHGSPSDSEDKQSSSLRE